MKAVPVLVLLLAWLPVVRGQQQASVPATRVAGTPYAVLEPVLRALGYLSTPGEGSITVQSPDGVLTLFAGSPDGLWAGVGAAGAEEVSFAAPIILRADGWFAPLDTFGRLNVGVEADTLTLPDGRVLVLAFPAASADAAAGAQAEVEDLGNGLVGIRFFVPGVAGPDTVSLLITDLGLLVLAYPEQRRELGETLTELGQDRPLYFVLASLGESGWEPAFVLEQGGRSFETRHPFWVRILEGGAESVTPEAPVSGVILVPESSVLTLPLRITWGGVTGEVTFRR